MSHYQTIKKKIKFLYKKANKNIIKSIKDLKLISFGNIIEYPIKAIDYLETIIKKVDKFGGGLLFFDYGYVQTKNYDTVQAINKHRYSNLLSNPGSSDITSHVNFNLFRKIFKKHNFEVRKIITQNEFLQKMGIMERAYILSKKMTFRGKADMFYRLKKLLDYREMGSLFKVFFTQKKNGKFSLGF